MAAPGDKGKKGRKRTLLEKSDFYIPIGTNSVEREKDDARGSGEDLEQQMSSLRLQFEQVGKELRVAFPEKVERWEEIIRTTIADHEARMAEIRLENIRARVKIELCDMEGQKVKEYSDLFERCLGVELQKRMRLEDSLAACEENLQAEKKKRINLEENLRISKQNVDKEKTKFSLQVRVSLGEIEKRVRLEDSLTTCEENLEVEKNKRIELEEDLRISKQNVEQEKEKQMCQICMDNPRNAVVLPCLHFLYCAGCLQTHQRASNECPTCRGSIGAILNCKLNLE